MTTLTDIALGEQASISVYPNHKLNKINDNIYGGFTEHMGRCIYGGLYDPDNEDESLIDENGFRKDVIQATKDLGCPVMRYPGGNFCATYHWLDGVGPRESRPKRPELAWLGVESNHFGTDEFMKWCELAGCEPYLALNMGTALAWLEYCNSSKDTFYANLRRQNGREQPYNVKYWAIGNECWGPWQVEQTTKEDYAKKAFQWAKAMKLLDPSVVLILCGETGHSAWDYHVLKECLKMDNKGLYSAPTTSALINMHSIHHYTASSDHAQNASAPRSAERAIEICSALIDLARIDNGVPPTVPRPTICFDEWNVWDPERAPGDKGAEELYTLSDALAVAVWLNVFVRQSKHLGMANIAQSVNVISPLMTTKKGLVKQTTWWPLLLFSKYMRGWNIGVHVASSTYDGDTKPAWVKGAIMDTPWLDVSATCTDDGWIALVVVNTHQSQNFQVDLSGIKPVEGPVRVYTVTGRSWDVVNTELDQAVDIQEKSVQGVLSFEFPRLSMTMFRWRV
ncbi:glycoside hydrolase family 51 protein [Polychaeton citri CBS 116435]|uniref:non-reducing end alpha-L-arabinofuranosidase n=1 Tax=Polychaeton citri CBS 116435 TaxID=1314669 RepID=A0A9P4QB93_9PEZI|nr:glycoside hydrolase family 51 protein [Polychaeton citri CBS 116435]